MNPSFSLILEIQSGLVRGALVSSARPDAKKTIEASSTIVAQAQRTVSLRGKSVSGAQVESARMLSNMTKALGEVLDELSKMHTSLSGQRGTAIHISSTECILSSPWVASRAKNVRIVFEKNTTVTAPAIGKMIAQERQNMIGLDMIVVEQKIFDIKINGYSTSSFKGLKARELEVFFAVSMSSQEILDAISNTIEKHFGARMKKITYLASTLMDFAVSRLNSKDDMHYILGHIHSELTDIVVVKNGIASLVATIPFGYDTLVREVSKKMNEPESFIHSKMSLHSKKHLHAQETSRLDSIAAEILENIWARSFVDIISSGSTETQNSVFVPYQVVLHVPKQYFSPFQSTLQSPVEKKESLGDKVHRFIVTHVNTDLLHHLIRL